MTGLQRECPSCGELARPDGYVCLECGAWLVEPKHLDDRELQTVLDDWYGSDRPRRVDDPEQREREIREWDESREREQRERERVAQLWQRRRERWKKFAALEEEPPQDILYADDEPIDRGDTGRGAAADTARPKGTT